MTEKMNIEQKRTVKCIVLMTIFCMHQ